MKTTISSTLSDLQDFVVHQAAEDAGLSRSERVHQEALVKDVLDQEAPSRPAFKKLLKLYHTGIPAA